MVNDVETPEQLEGRKQRELEELLAKGWRTEDLEWWYPGRWKEGSDSEAFKKLRAQCSGTFRATEGQRAAVQRTRDRLKRGCWLITSEGRTRFHARRTLSPAG